MTSMESNMEIEYKFWAGDVSKQDFHTILENAIGKQYEPKYVCSCDDYYTNEYAESFLRYRKGGSRTELTLKQKREGNIVRKEINLDMTTNHDSSVVEFLSLSGYNKAFSVFKEAWIWDFADCDVSYYILSDGRAVIELEALIYSSTAEGVSIIDKWSDKLNCSQFERESRSLFEIFTEEMQSLCSSEGCDTPIEESCRKIEKETI
jgi:adenylate cyclase class IV